MTTSATTPKSPCIQAVSVSSDSLTVELADGRTVSVPIAWYPRLQNGSIMERKRWQIIGDGTGIHWPDLNEDISAENLLFGQPSGESQKSLAQWLSSRPRKSARRLKPALHA